MSTFKNDERLFRLEYPPTVALRGKAWEAKSSPDPEQPGSPLVLRMIPVCRPQTLGSPHVRRI